VPEDDDNVLRLEWRRRERKVPGLGPCVFVALGADSEVALARHYDDPAPDHRAYVNELISAAIAEPAVDEAGVDALSDRARAIARVATADVCGCASRYRALSGKGRSGDERLFDAMREHHSAQIVRLGEMSTMVTENVVRMADRTREALLKSGAFDYLERNRRGEAA
jgi:hypothetical protein